MGYKDNTVLTTSDLVLRIEGLLFKKNTAAHVADWAAEQHTLYENGEIEIETGQENDIARMLIDLIHNEDDPFRLSEAELKHMRAQLLKR